MEVEEETHKPNHMTIVSGVDVSEPADYRVPDGAKLRTLYDSKWPLHRRPYWVGWTLSKKPHGWGYVLDRQANVLYVGHMFAGSRENFGVSYVPRTKHERKHGLSPSKAYEGFWRKDYYQGHGTLYHGHNITFMGKFMYGRRHGKGVSYVTDRRFSRPQVDREGLWDHGTFLE